MQEPDARPTEDTVETEENADIQTAPEVDDTEDETEDTEAPAEEAAETDEIDETPERTLEDAEGDLETERKRSAYLQRQVEKVKKTAPETEEAQPADSGFGEPEPEENNYSDYSDWVKDHNKWSARLAAHEVGVENQRVAFQKRLDPGFKKYDDFAEVALEKEMPLHLQEAIFQTDIAADVAYYIGKTPGELARLSSLTPVAAGMEVARIQVQLKTGVPMKHTTNSPGKTSPTGGKTTLSVDLDSGKLPTADYIAQKNAAEGIA